MAINGLCNKRCGPGGGTRRLHQFTVPATPDGIRGRNRIDARVKTCFLPGMVPPLSGYFTDANDNFAHEDYAVAA